MASKIMSSLEQIRSHLNNLIKEAASAGDTSKRQEHEQHLKMVEEKIRAIKAGSEVNFTDLPEVLLGLPNDTTSGNERPKTSKTPQKNLKLPPITKSGTSPRRADVTPLNVRIEAVSTQGNKDNELFRELQKLKKENQELKDRCEALLLENRDLEQELQSKRNSTVNQDEWQSEALMSLIEQNTDDGRVKSLQDKVNELELQVGSLRKENENLRTKSQREEVLLSRVLGQNNALTDKQSELESALEDRLNRCRLLEIKNQEASQTCEILIKQNEQNQKEQERSQQILNALRQEKERIQRENEQLKSRPVESRISCGICFEPGDSTTEWQAISVCGHVFCDPCINRLEVQNAKKKCPTCRFEFEDYERIKVFF